MSPLFDRVTSFNREAATLTCHAEFTEVGFIYTMPFFLPHLLPLCLCGFFSAIFRQSHIHAFIGCHYVILFLIHLWSIARGRLRRQHIFVQIYAFNEAYSAMESFGARQQNFVFVTRGFTALSSISTKSMLLRNTISSPCVFQSMRIFYIHWLKQEACLF